MVFLRRLSAPAEKWQLAQAWTASLPTCISQKRAFPSLMAAGLFLTNWNRLGGSGTGIWLRGRKVGGGIACPGAPHAPLPASSDPVTVSSPRRINIADVLKLVFI